MTEESPAAFLASIYEFDDDDDDDDNCTVAWHSFVSAAE